jgi:hypothetical protein
MNIVDWLERKFGDFEIPNLTYYLIGGQALAFILIQFYPDYAPFFSLNGDAVMQGQWWRIFLFLFQPISMDFLFAVFSWYLFYLYGTALERLWGSFRFILYILIAYVGTVILAFVFPSAGFSNAYIFGSLFLAFAYRFPDFELLLFFIIPVKVKWLAIAIWIGMAGAVFLGSFATKIQTIVSILNFLLFFGDELIMIARERLHHRAYTRNRVNHDKPYHVCTVCGKNEVDNPDMEIRYCNTCVPSRCYCGEHIKQHKHTIMPS